MILPRAIGGVKVEAPESARTGEAIRVLASVTDAVGTGVRAVIPVHVEIRDSNGRLAEGSGYYGAEDGKPAEEVKIKTILLD